MPEKVVELSPYIIGLIEQAKEIEGRVNSPQVSDYFSVIEVLQEKNLTWEEIRDFFKKQGLDFSMQSLCSAYRRHKRRNHD